MGQGPFGLPGVVGGDGDLEASDASADLCADLEELEADSAAGGGGELGALEADTPECADQDIGHGCEPEPELVGAQGGRRGAVSQQIELTLLDPVLGP